MSFRGRGMENISRGLNGFNRFNPFNPFNLRLIILLLISNTLAAQSPDRRIDMLKIQQKITIDGVLDEGVWESAPSAIDFVQQEPKEGTPMSYPTEIKVLYDDENLYF